MRTVRACLTLAFLAGSWRPVLAQAPPPPSAEPAAAAPAEPSADRRLTQLELRAFHVLGSGLSFRRVSAADVLGQRQAVAADRPNAVRAAGAATDYSTAIQPAAGDDVEQPTPQLVQSAAEVPAALLPAETVDLPSNGFPSADADRLRQGPAETGSHVSLGASDPADEPGSSTPLGSSELPATDSAGNPLRHRLTGSAGAPDAPNPLRRWFRPSGE